MSGSAPSDVSITSPEALRQGVVEPDHLVVGDLHQGTIDPATGAVKHPPVLVSLGTDMATTTTRSVTLPALLYVLAAFGIVAGFYGGWRAIGSAAMFAKPREVYLEMVTANNEGLRPFVAAADLERFDARDADARYARRDAALPLAGVGIILSCLLFAGAVRTMRGDGWGLSAWSFAAAASIPYQLVSLALELVRARDLSQAVAALPPMAQVLVGDAQRWASMVGCALAILYYGACVIYLRTPPVRRAFSDGARGTPPSA